MQTLTYDNLPPGSTILREWKDGALTIIAAAREIDPFARSRVLKRTAIYAAWTTAITFGALLVCAVAINIPLPPTLLLNPIVFSLTVLCFGALFLLLWTDRWHRAHDRLEWDLKEQTVILARPNELRIESDGPRGVLSRVLRRDEILDISAYNEFAQELQDRLVIHLKAGGRIQLLFGRLPAELDWVARTLQQVIDQSAESPPSPGI